MMKNRLAIVILNYNCAEDTVECIDSILRQEDIEIETIIVDNGSTDDSVNVLTRRFGDTNRIHIIVNDKNLGFARGNNVGIRFAREELNCAYVFVLNADTVILDRKCCVRLLESTGAQVGLICPECQDKDGKTQTPYGKYNNLYKAVLRELMFIIWQYIKILLNANWSVSQWKEKRCNNVNDRAYAVSYKYIVQGPAFILTPAFFKYYSRLYPHTFLYEEELILAFYLKKASLKTCYREDCKIYHKEGGSSGNYVSSISRLKKNNRSLVSWFKMLPVVILNYTEIVRVLG